MHITVNEKKNPCSATTTTRIIVWYRDCHVTFQPKISFLELILAERDGFRIRHLVSQHQIGGWNIWLIKYLNHISILIVFHNFSRFSHRSVILSITNRMAADAADALGLLILCYQIWGGHFKFIDHVTSSVSYKDSTTKKTTISSYPSRPGWLLMLLACWSYVWRPFSWSYEIMCGTCVRHPWTTRAAHKIGLMISSKTRQK